MHHAALTHAALTLQRGSVSDEASATLAAVRVERRDNADKLRQYMEEVARGLFAKGASDSRSVTLIRDRYCVGIKVSMADCMHCCLLGNARSISLPANTYLYYA